MSAPDLPIVTKCRCGNTATIVVTTDEYAAWRAGAFVQDAFPRLSADDRERLLTGICPTCWERLAPDDEEEDILQAVSP